MEEENNSNPDTEIVEETAEKIIDIEIEDEMKSSYLDYAMSVIVSRALPDVRDGLKPVHRRILYGMHSMGMHYNKPSKKSARIVGEVLGKYHPHGDQSVYDALVRMSQSFSLRYPLIKGQGNFGSIDGDRAAAMRYTEAKLHKISNELLQDIEKDTVKFVPNFDASLEEPSVLPAKLPNLLINGASGIAVGMATNIPPHNLNEVCKGIIRVIENPETTVEDLLEIVTGPDFPTGAEIIGKRGIIEAYGTGKGKVKVRAKTHLEEVKGRIKLVIDEIPYQVNKALLITQIADLVKDKVMTGISDIRDESDKDGMRIVIEVKRDANTDIILNQLYKHTRCQTTFGVNLLALVDNKPKVLNLLEIMQHYIKHRKDVVRKRTEFDLKKAQKKAHLLEGLQAALNDIDNVIKLIKGSKSVELAREGLMSLLSIDKVQANAILEMQLQKLTSLEQDKIKNDLEELKKIIAELISILESEKRILEIIKSELEEVDNSFGDGRNTQILEIDDEDLDIEDLIKPENVVVTISNVGYIKRVLLGEYKQQKRGGRGIIAASTKEEDFIVDLFVANTHDTILYFTNKGKVKWLKVYKIPNGSRQSKGTAIVNLLELEKDEQVTSYVTVKEFDDKHAIVMSTKNGLIKKCSLTDFSRPRKGGIIAINLEENDTLINTVLTDGTKEIIIATKNGNAVRFNENNVRTVGRSAKGVRGISLKTGDCVIGMVIAENDKTILSVTENGYGKRTKVADYRLTQRGGLGVINIKTSERNGTVISIKTVTDDDELMFISKKGVLIRTRSSGISVIGRNTMGVRLMRLSENDSVTSVAKIISDDIN